jgi:ribosome-binding factor A
MNRLVLSEVPTMTSPRIARLRELFKQETSAILRRDMKDPRIGFVSVTDVELTPDLRHARIFVSVYGDAEAKARTMAGLRSAEGFVRTELAQRIRLRYIPQVSFRIDESIEQGDRINRLLRQVTGEHDGPDRAGGREGGGGSRGDGR